MFERKKEICERINNIIFKDDDYINNNIASSMYRLGITLEEIELLEKSKYCDVLIELLSNKDFMKKISVDTRKNIIEIINNMDSEDKAILIKNFVTNKKLLDILKESTFVLLISPISKIKDYNIQKSIFDIISLDKVINSNYLYSLGRNLAKIEYLDFDKRANYAALDNIKSLIVNSKVLDFRLNEIIGVICNLKKINQVEYGSLYATRNLESTDILDVLKIIGECKNYDNLICVCDIAENFENNKETKKKNNYMGILKMFAKCKDTGKMFSASNVAVSDIAFESKYYRELIELVMNAKDSAQAQSASLIACDSDAINSPYILDFVKMAADADNELQADLAYKMAVSLSVLEREDAKELVEIASKAKGLDYLYFIDLSDIFTDTHFVYNHVDINKIFKTICEVESSAVKRFCYDIVIDSDSNELDMCTDYSLFDKVDIIGKCRDEKIAEIATKFALDKEREKDWEKDYKYIEKICSCKSPEQANIVSNLIYNDDFRNNVNNLALLDILINTEEEANMFLLSKALTNKDLLDNHKNIELYNLISSADEYNDVNTYLVATSKDVLDSSSPIRLTKMASEGVSSKNLIGLAKIMNAYIRPKYEPKTIKKIKKIGNKKK